MSFTDKDIFQLLCGRTWLLRDEDVLLKTAHILLQHGLGKEVVTNLIGELPYDIYENSRSLSQLPTIVDDSLIQLRSSNILPEKSLKIVLLKNPLILVQSISDVILIHNELKQLFTKEHASYVIKKSPNVLIDSWDETSKKFDYAYFEMAYHQKDIVNSHLFSHSFEHIENRHLFITCSGHFKQLKEVVEPHLNVNPSLKDVVDSPLPKFVKMCGVKDVNEFYAFENIREVERENEVEDEYDSDSSEDEDGQIVKKRLRTKKKKKFIKWIHSSS